MKALYFSIFLLISSVPSLLGQTNDQKNIFDFAVFSITNRLLNFSSPANLKSTGVITKYKRVIHRDEVNRFSVGLAYQNFKPKFTWISYNELQSEQRSDNIYDWVESQQEIQSIGLILSDRISTRRKNVGFFLDLELLTMYQFIFKQQTTYQIGALLFSNSFSWGQEAPVDGFQEIQNEFKINRLMGYLSIQPSFEFYLKNYNLNLGLNISQNINSLYKDTIISSDLPTIKDYYFSSIGLSLGISF